MSAHPRFPQAGAIAHQSQHIYRWQKPTYSFVDTIGDSAGAETHDRPLYWWYVWGSCCPRVRLHFPLSDSSRSRSDLASNDNAFRAGLFDLFQPDLPARASTPDRCRQRISNPAKIVSGLIPAFCNAKPQPLQIVPRVIRKILELNQRI